MLCSAASSAALQSFVDTAVEGAPRDATCACGLPNRDTLHVCCRGMPKFLPLASTAGEPNAEGGGKAAADFKKVELYIP